MKIIGLTGGIGSGKSTIGKMFEDLGVPVYYADDQAKKIMQCSETIKRGVIKLFGKEAYKNNELNKKYIAEIVFKDKTKLKKLNQLVHPIVYKHFLNWVKKQNAIYVIQENAILFENKNQNNFDMIITVTAPKDVKIQRVIIRDDTSKESVLARMKNQLDDAIKANKSDYVIDNLDIKESRKIVNRIHKELLQKLT